MYVQFISRFKSDMATSLHLGSLVPHWSLLGLSVQLLLLDLPDPQALVPHVVPEVP